MFLYFKNPIKITPYVRPLCYVESNPNHKILYDHLRLNFPENVTSVFTGFKYPSNGGHYELSEIRIKGETMKYCQDRYEDIYKSELPAGITCAKALYDGIFNIIASFQDKTDFLSISSQIDWLRHAMYLSSRSVCQQP